MIKLVIIDENNKQIDLEELTDNGREIIKADVIELLDKLNYPSN